MAAQPASPSGTPCPPCTCPCRHRRLTWRLKTTWPKVGYWSPARVPHPLVAAAYSLPHSAKDTARPQVQDLVAVQEEFRARKRRAVLGLQNRPANSKSHGARRGAQRRVYLMICQTPLTIRSKTRLQATWKTPQIYRKASFRTTRRRRDMATSCSCCSRNRGTSRTSPGSFPWPRSTPSFRPSCSPSTETSMRVVKSIFCSPCFRCALSSVSFTRANYG